MRCCTADVDIKQTESLLRALYMSVVLGETLVAGEHLLTTLMSSFPTNAIQRLSGVADNLYFAGTFVAVHNKQQECKPQPSMLSTLV